MAFFYSHPLVLASLAVTASALLLGLLVLLSAKNRGRRRRRRRHPLVGTVIHQLLHLAKLHDYHADLARRYRNFRLLHPVSSFVVLTEPADVEHILKANFANYGKGSYNYDIGEDLFGDGIFAVDGDKWRQQRKLASYEFTARNLKDYSSGIFRRKAVALAAVISETAASNRAMDIQDLFMKSTLDSIFNIGFGMELDTLSGSNDEGTRFAKAFDASSELILRRCFDVLWKIKRILNIGTEAALKEHIKVVDAFVYMVIQRKTEQILTHQSASMKEDILSRLIAESDRGEKMSSKYLRDIILNILIAGRDTTAGTLSWFLYILCKHPDMQEKVAQEVAMATGAASGIPVTDFGALLTEAALEKMQYLHAALTETLRLYPAVPIDSKACLSDDTLPDGFEVRAGDTVCYVPYAMGRMKHLWGEDAEEFSPDRWLDEHGVFRQESPFKFSAFQAGPRICLGKEFAYRQMKIFAAVLVHFFKFQLTDAGKEVNSRTTITLQIDQGLFVRAFGRAHGLDA